MARNLREDYGDDMPLLSSFQRGGTKGQPTPVRYRAAGSQATEQHDP